MVTPEALTWMACASGWTGSPLGLDGPTRDQGGVGEVEGGDLIGLAARTVGRHVDQRGRAGTGRHGGAGGDDESVQDELTARVAGDGKLALEQQGRGARPRVRGTRG